jgi:transposase InsO family protein
MYQTMKISLYWAGMQKDVASYVKACESCARCKRGGPRYGKLPLKTIIAHPWVEIAIDSLGPFQQKYRALTIIDTSTRLVTVIPTFEGTSFETAQVADWRWFNECPRPQRCIYDQGSEFGREFQELLLSYGVKSKPTTVKNPQANAIVERVHGTINNKLRTCKFESKDEWANYLSSVTFSLRATYHTMLGCSPAQAAFGRDMFFDLTHKTDWQEQHKRKVEQVKKANAHENARRVAPPTTKSMCLSTSPHNPRWILHGRVHSRSWRCTTMAPWP